MNGSGKLIKQKWGRSKSNEPLKDAHRTSATLHEPLWEAKCALMPTRDHAKSSL